MLPEGKKSRIAEFIEHHISRSAFSYTEIAIICGFNTNVVLYGWMSGDFKVPLNKVTKLAGALNVDAGQLFALAVEDWFSPGLFAEMRDHFMSLPAAGPEVAWVDVLREIFDGNVPPMTDEIRSRLETAFASVERRRTEEVRLRALERAFRRTRKSARPPGARPLEAQTVKVDQSGGVAMTPTAFPLLKARNLHPLPKVRSGAPINSWSGCLSDQRRGEGERLAVASTRTRRGASAGVLDVQPGTAPRSPCLRDIRDCRKVMCPVCQSHYIGSLRRSDRSPRTPACDRWECLGEPRAAGRLSSSFVSVRVEARGGRHRVERNERKLSNEITKRISQY